MYSKRYVVERCDNTGSPEIKRITYAVVDKWNNRACVLDTDSRAIAYDTSRDYNGWQRVFSALVALCTNG